MNKSELYYEDYVKKDVDAASSFLWGKDTVSMYEFKMEGFHHNFKIRLFHTQKNVITVRDKYGYPIKQLKVSDWDVKPYTIDCHWLKPFLLKLLEFHDPAITASCIVENFFIGYDHA